MNKGKKHWKTTFLKKQMMNINLSTTTLSIESVSTKMIELVKEKETNIEKKNIPLQEKITKQNERITELEKKEKENVEKIKGYGQKIKKLKSENKAIGGFTRFFINSFLFCDIFKETSKKKK